MADMDQLIKDCKSRNLRLILDLVINHTSDKHAWFEESRSSRDNPKRDWYIWRDAKKGPNGERLPVNNWRNNFNGSAWTWDEKTQQYYLNLFCPEQPDLNWTSEACRKQIYEDAMVFWLEKGIDGFRVDTVSASAVQTDLGTLLTFIITTSRSTCTASPWTSPKRQSLTRPTSTSPRTCKCEMSLLSISPILTRNPTCSSSGSTATAQRCTTTLPRWATSSPNTTP